MLLLEAHCWRLQRLLFGMNVWRLEQCEGSEQSDWNR